MNDLDAEELFHLALKASDDGDRDKTIAYLKRSIELDPQANSVYLLAAEYAEIGMMQRAIGHMQQALELNPELWTAWFQLGLLYLTQNLAQEARQAFAPLLEAGPEEHMFLFGKGMTQLLDDQIEESLESLAAGVELNDANPALNRDVTRIIDHINSELGPQASTETTSGEAPVSEAPPLAAAKAATAEADPAPAQKQHVFLSNYGKGSDGS